MENKFVDYLNTLHNEQSANVNALAESQVNTAVFKKIEVVRPAAQYLANRILNNDNGCLIILTGHAGDGKTTLLFQMLSLLNVPVNGKEQDKTICLESGKNVHYVKDFSELTTMKREEVLKKALEDSDKGIYTIIVANTGPLIETFKKVFSDHIDAEAKIIDCIDSVENSEREVYGHAILFLNIALLDNTSFIEPYTKKILHADNWSVCVQCSNENRCPIYRNIKLLQSHSQAISFVRDFYIWEAEHDRRATIRQISAHIAYAITGGLDCNTVELKSLKVTDYLFSNLLFGEATNIKNKKLNQIKGIKMINDLAIDENSTSFDYALFVQKNYNEIFAKDENIEVIYNTIEKMSSKKISDERKRIILKRMMLVFSRDIGEERDRLYRDVFSTCYPKYLGIRNGMLKPKNDIKEIIYQALRITFAGQGKTHEDIYITLRRSGENIQNVHLLIGRISMNDLDVCSIKQVNSEVSGQEFYQLILQYNNGFGKKMIKISLPLLNYFEKIVNGMIITNVDPLLSHGIESLKSELLALCHHSKLDNNEIEVVVQTSMGCQRHKLYFEANKISN